MQEIHNLQLKESNKWCREGQGGDLLKNEKEETFRMLEMFHILSGVVVTRVCR